MKKYILLLVVAYLFSNCEKTIPLDLDQHESKYIIEGLITNQEKQHSIRISKTVPFNATEPAEKVSDAKVSVQDNHGNRFDFLEDTPGLYLSTETFSGQVGHAYTLHVAVAGQNFTASEMLPPIAKIDSIVYAINEDEKANPDADGAFYEVLLFMDEPQQTEDYYIAKFFRNGELENDEGESVFYFNDLILSDRISGLAAPYFYNEQDNFRFELYSLSRKAFRYYFELDNNINSDGGVFSGTPANIMTNLEGGAIGYFQASGIVDASVLIE